MGTFKEWQDDISLPTKTTTGATTTTIEDLGIRGYRRSNKGDKLPNVHDNDYEHKDSSFYWKCIAVDKEVISSMEVLDSHSTSEYTWVATWKQRTKHWECA